MNIGNPVRRSLLIGAGFSKNFGGYLASEVNDQLLANNELRQHRRVLSLVRNDFNFESALMKARRGGFDAEELSALENSIRAVFRNQNRIVVDYFNPHYKKFGGKTVLYTFLKMFGVAPPEFDSTYFFSLNQDLLIESWHGSNISMQGKPIGHLGLQIEDSHIRANNWWFGTRRPTDEDLCRTVEIRDEASAVAQAVASGRTNFVKLHGSSDWHNKRGNLIVLGGDKEALINESPLLSYYHEVFQGICETHDMRLFVIGYGFGDEHINAMITRGCKMGLQVWVWDTMPRQMWSERIGDAMSAEDSESLLDVTRYVSCPIHETLGGNLLSQTTFEPTVDAFFEL